jgi:hypothetical protein
LKKPLRIFAIGIIQLFRFLGLIVFVLGFGLFVTLGTFGMHPLQLLKGAVLGAFTFFIFLPLFLLVWLYPAVFLYESAGAHQSEVEQRLRKGAALGWGAGFLLVGANASSAYPSAIVIIVTVMALVIAVLAYAVRGAWRSA